MEPFGIDESWLDVTGSLHLFGGDPLALAHQLRRRVRGELGLTISVGALQKRVCQAGQRLQKTGRRHPDLAGQLSCLGLASAGDRPALCGPGGGDARWRSFGVRTIGDLARFDREALISCCTRPPKSVGNGLTFRRNLQGREEIRTGIAMLSDQVAARLRRHGMKCGSLGSHRPGPQFSGCEPPESSWTTPFPPSFRELAPLPLWIWPTSCGI